MDIISHFDVIFNIRMLVYFYLMMVFIVIKLNIILQ